MTSHFLAIMEPMESCEAGDPAGDPAAWAKQMQVRSVVFHGLRPKATVLGLDDEYASMEFLVQGLLRVATLLDCPKDW